MSNHLSALLISLLALAVVGTNVYWYRRERIVRDGLTVSQEWDSKTKGTTSAQRTIDQTAELLNTSPDAVVEEVESLVQKVRSLQGAIEDGRQRWASFVWAALESGLPASRERPLIVHLPDGDDEDATALAKQVERDGVTVICGEADKSFTVDVGDTSRWSAIDIAADITAGIPGGAGGSERFAQGGSNTDEVFERCRSICAERTDTDPTVLLLNCGSEE